MPPVAQPGLPVAPGRQAPLVGQPQLQVDLTLPSGRLGAVPQLGHHLPKVPLVFLHAGVRLRLGHQVQRHLVRPWSQGSRPPWPLPLAFGVPGLAQPQEDGEGEKEQLGKKATCQRWEIQVSLWAKTQGPGRREGREALWGPPSPAMPGLVPPGHDTCTTHVCMYHSHQ